MLKIGAYLNILIAIAHLIGLIWADQMFEVTGIAKEMQTLSQTHVALPYFLTIFVAICFFIFGLYGLSAVGQFRELPFLKLAIFTIAGIYLLRGIGELLFDLADQTASPIAETIYSLIAIMIGLLFLVGGWKKWAR